MLTFAFLHANNKLTMASFWWFHHAILLLLTILSLLTTTTIHAMPPPPPVHCDKTGCTVSNAVGEWGDRKDCRVQTIIYPKTEQELVQAVANATQKNLKVKVVTKFSHSIPKLACPGANPEKSMVISTALYDTGIIVDKEKMEVIADSGVGIRDLIDKVEEAGLSLVASTYWEGVSVGGMISTGAHGSSWWGKGGAVHEQVIGLNLIVAANESQGFAKLMRLEENDPLFNAARVSLGMLGVISKVTFSLEKGFKRSITYNFTDDSGVEKEFEDHGKRHEFADITWFPSQKRAAYRYDDRVPLNASGDGVYDFLGFQPIPVENSIGIRAAEKAMDEAGSTDGKCTLAETILSYKESTANGLKNDKTFTGYPVIGRQGKMQTSGSCLHSPSSEINNTCTWDPRIKGMFFYESGAIFSAQNFGNFVRDVKKLRDLKPEKFCGIDFYNGFFIRFIKASEAYLGQPEDSVAVDFNYYRADEAATPRLNQDVMEEVEQMAFFKYGARPHWAKNRNLAFLDVQKKYPNGGKFVAAMEELDPLKMFSTEFTDEILLGKERNKVDGCALEGLCICSEDRHCSPSNGYLCKEGLIYKEARVCRHSNQ